MAVVLPHVFEALAQGTTLLEASGVDSPRLNAELLLAHVLQTPRLHLLLDNQRVLSPADSDSFHSLLRQRAQRIPLQHLTGTTNFLGLDLRVSRDVLVPRPETECLVEHAIAMAQPLGPCRILDFATGSGCIAIALAHHLPLAEVHALDLSSEALSIARQNAESNHLSHRIQFHLGNGFHALTSLQSHTPTPFHLIVSNPPYIPSDEIASLDPEVRDHDPRIALDGGRDGLVFYRRLAEEAPVWLHPEGCFLAEFGDGQGPGIQELFRSRKFWGKSRLEKDLSDRERIIIVTGGNRSTANT